MAVGVVSMGVVSMGLMAVGFRSTPTGPAALHLHVVVQGTRHLSATVRRGGRVLAAVAAFRRQAELGALCEAPHAMQRRHGTAAGRLVLSTGQRGETVRFGIRVLRHRTGFEEKKPRTRRSSHLHNAGELGRMTRISREIDRCNENMVYIFAMESHNLSCRV